MKKNKMYLINILAVVLVFIISLAILKIYPFGGYLLGKSDSFSQYKPMLYNFIMSIKTGTLSIYSFNNGLGNSFLFNYLYYLVSPVNLVGLLFNNANMMFFSVVLVKLIISSVTVTFYAKKKDSSDIVSFCAALSYTFSGWLLAYYYNIMWLDLFMIFPLFQYGLEQLVENKKCLIFIFTLAYMYATNFLISFSILVYMFIYFIIRVVFYNKEKWYEKVKKAGLFIVSIVLSVMLIAFYMSALVLVKKQMGLGFSNVEDASYTLQTMSLLKSLIYGNINLTTLFSGETYPNLGMNTIVLFSLFAFFFNKKIEVKDKLFSLIGINIVVLFLFSKNLDYIANMFHNVVGLTYRYAFIFNFLAIMLFIKNANNTDIKNKKIALIPIVISMIILLVCHKEIENKILIMNLVYIISYLIFVCLYSDNKYYKLIIYFLVFSQSIWAVCYAIPSNLEVEFDKYGDGFVDDGATYRKYMFDGNSNFNKNLYTNEENINLFSSMSYNDVMLMLGELGCKTGSNSINCNSYDDLLYLLFNVKKDIYLEKIYSVNKDIKDVFVDGDNVKKSRELIVSSMTGIEDLYDTEIIYPVLEDDKYVYNVNYPLYLMKETIEGNDYIYFPDFYSFYSVNNTNNPIEIYLLKEEKLKEIYEALKDNQIEYSYYSDSKLEGKINVLDNQMIFTSIPYDDAWIVKIDGKEVEKTKILDSLIGIECDSGEHEISMEYKVNLIMPTIISICTFILLVSKGIYNLIRDRKIKE